MKEILKGWKQELAKQAKDILKKFAKTLVLAIGTKLMEEYIIKPLMRKIEKINKKHGWKSEEYDFRTAENVA